MGESGFKNIKKQEGLAVASIARDVGSSSTNRSSDIMHFHWLRGRTFNPFKLCYINCNMYRLYSRTVEGGESSGSQLTQVYM